MIRARYHSLEFKVLKGTNYILPYRVSSSPSIVEAGVQKKSVGSRRYQIAAQLTSIHLAPKVPLGMNFSERIQIRK